MYRRVIVFVAHPNRIFYASQEEQIIQEKPITVAAKIAKINFVEGYYTDRKWKEVVPTNFRNQATRKFFEIEFSDNQSQPQASSRSNSEGSLPLIAQNRVGRWDVYFSDGAPSSITESWNIVAQALSEMHNHEGVQNWEKFTDFPVSVQKWLGRQKETLFKDTPVDSAADIRTVYDRTIATTEHPLIENFSLSDMILALMKQHAKILERFPTSKMDDLIYCSIKSNVVVEVVCRKCKQTLTTDTSVRWSMNRPGHYVVRTRRCNSSLCQGDITFAIQRHRPSVCAWELNESAGHQSAEVA